MKFESLHPRSGSQADAYDFRDADAVVDFAEQNNMQVRAHCLVWHQQVPAWVRDGASSGKLDPPALQQILQQHIATVAGRYAGKVYAWDVVNEAFNDDGTMRSTVWYDAPGIGMAGKGPAYIEQALRWARAADKDAKLIYNDYSNEEINPKSDAIYAMAKDFRKRNVPLDGIGFQLHVHMDFADPQKLLSFAENVKRFSDLGLEIHFTELDIALDSDDPKNLEAQGKLYREISNVCVKNRRCKLLQTWGFTDKYSWIPDFSKGKQGWALPLDANYQKKPAYTAMLKALNKK